jgi:glucose/arabinose dehydrogenase
MGKKHRPFPALFRRLIFVALAIAIFVVPLKAANTVELPDDFIDEVVVPNLNLVATMEFLPDGKILLAELGGTIRIVAAGATQPNAAPFAVLPSVAEGDGGLLDITIDPQFADNGFVYVFYSHTSGRDRLSRLTAAPGWETAISGSETILWQDAQRHSIAHHGATAAFGPDGKLYFSTGEQFAPDESQSLSSYRGKILRINADGTIPIDNPFHDGAGPNKDEIWAYGLRNPFRFSFDTLSGKMFIGDVGGNEPNSLEEINIGLAGRNYGWPLCEGPCNNPSANRTDPIHSYSHAGRDASVIGGFVYRGIQFPEEFQGSYFFADYVQNWIKYLTFDTNGNVAAVHPFLPRDGAQDNPAAGDIVKLKQGPDGALYYLDLSLGISNYEEISNAGSLRRIRYLGAGNRPPVAVASANPATGPSPLTVNFIGSGSVDPDGNTLTYSWDFGDGTTSTIANPTHVYAQSGRFNAVLTVSDGTDTHFASIGIRVGNSPTATILTPLNESLFRAGDNIRISGTGSDPEDGNLPTTAFRWDIVFRHETHVHPVMTVNATNSLSFEIHTTGHDYHGNTRYEIILTVTDSDGLQHSTSVLILPQKVNLNFDSLPSGLTLRVDGIVKTTPFVHDTLVGFEHTLEAPDQNQGDSAYTFASWSDGGVQSHKVIVPAENRSYTATFNLVPDTTPPTIASVTLLSANIVQVRFSEPVTAAAAEAPGNYAIDNGVTILSADLSDDPRTVTLTTSELTAGNYALTINNVADRATPPNLIAANSQHTFQVASVHPRVSHGLVVLYGFHEGAGEIVHDLSGSGTPLDLAILDPARIQWLGGGSNGVRFVTAGSAIRSPGSAGKLHSALIASNRLTLEAWVTPANLSQDDPARIATISDGTASSDVNVHLGQIAGAASYRLRTPENSFSWMQAGEVFTSTTTPLHLVATYDGSAQRLYVNGVQHSTVQSLSGDFSNWDPDYPLVFGNEATLDRSWLGTLHLAAIYNRALSLSEIQQNTSAGPSLHTIAVIPKVENLSARLENGRLVLTFSRTKQSAAVTVLLEAASLLAGPWSSEGLSQRVISDDGAVQTIEVTDSAAADTAESRFLRLSILPVESASP